MKCLISVFFFASLPFLLNAQTLFIDGNAVDRSQKLMMDSTSRLLIDGVLDDSLYLQLYHARGVTELGRKDFLRIDDFNKFDLWKWLKSEYHDPNKSLEKTGESPSKRSVKRGDRIAIILSRKKKMVGNWHLFVD